MFLDHSVPVSWEDAGQQLQQWLTHLDLVGSDVIKKMLESDDQQMKSYARKFDMSRSLPEKVSETENYNRSSINVNT